MFAGIMVIVPGGHGSCVCVSLGKIQAYTNLPKEFQWIHEPENVTFSQWRAGRWACGARNRYERQKRAVAK